jgi:hypothetical protein
MKKHLVTLILALAATTMWADSPLTSTQFWQIYNFPCDTLTFPIYQHFDKYGWSPEVKDDLCSPEISIEQRLCLVNLVGWNFNGQDHFEELVTYYMGKNNYKDRKLAFREMDGLMLSVFAYVKAMDDYFDVTEARKLSKEAVERAPNSRAVAMIDALIAAQIAMDSNWGKVYRVCQQVVDNKSLDKDFSDAAIYGIMEYINLYAEYEH